MHSFLFLTKLILCVTISAFVRMRTRVSLSANTLGARQKQHRITDKFCLTIIDWKTRNNFFLLACLQVHAKDNKMEFEEKKNQHLNVSNMDSISFYHIYLFIYFCLLPIDESEPLATPVWQSCLSLFRSSSDYLCRLALFCFVI